MSNRSFDIVNIVPGNFCNLRCTHCVNDSGPDRSDLLSQSEIEKIAVELNTFRPSLILFTGGEPTLHIDPINELLKRLTYQTLKCRLRQTVGSPSLTRN